MELVIPPEAEAFRAEVRTFLRSELPPEMSWRVRQGYHPTVADLREWAAILNRRGWACPEWPVEFGGPGWTALQAYIFEDECAHAGAPHIQWRVGIGLAGPVIYTFGSEAQREHYLPRIRSGEDQWCQGFSEPGAGSDLANLRTKAVRDGDQWVIDGSKIWTSEGHFADLMFALVRTDPDAKPQAGISCMAIDMRAPGVTVRPIPTIDDSHTINEVFLDSVRVPANSLIGEVNKGWSYAKFLLGHERHSNALVQRTKAELLKLRRALTAEGLADDVHLTSRLDALEIEVVGLEMAVLRAMCSLESGRDMAFTSALKIRGTELQQSIGDLAFEVLGPRLVPQFPEFDLESDLHDLTADAGAHVPGTLVTQMFRRAATIYSGTNEIQRGIIWGQAFARHL